MGILKIYKLIRITDFFAYVLLLNICVALIFELCLLFPHTFASKFSQDSIEDNEFAEFEEIEDDLDEFIDSRSKPSSQPTPAPPPVNTQTINNNNNNNNRKIDDNDGIVEEEEDDEEFETVSEPDESDKM